MVMLLFFVQVFRSSNITVDMDLVREIEAKYPAFLFKQQLTAFVEGLYGMIRDNVKKDLSSLLSYAIQVPFFSCDLQ
jgi:myosin V